MKIGIDARLLAGEVPSAHAATLRQVLLRNAECTWHHEFVLYLESDVRRLEGLEAPNVKIQVVPRRHDIASDFGWLNFDLPHQLRRDGVHVYFSCFYKIPIVPCVPCVNMVHDAAFFRLAPRFLTERHRSVAYRSALRIFLQAHCRRAALTITVSEYSKACLMEELRLPSSSVSVCYNAVDERLYTTDDRACRPRGVPEQYSLFIGSAIPKKNIPLTLRGFALLPEPLRMRFPLVLRTCLRPDLADLIAELRIGDSIWFIPEFLSDDELAGLVRNAKLLVLLSEEEGFGLPVAEAMAAGVPVLASSGGSLNEITGGMGIDTATSGPEEISQRWQRLLEDEECRRAAIERGRDRARTFRRDVVTDRLLHLITSASRHANS